MNLNSMDPSTTATIEKIQAKIAELEQEVFKRKEMINSLCDMEGEQLMYPDLAQSSQSSSPMTLRADQFFGRPLATAVREILEARWARKQGAASLNELFDAMKAGGFQFDNSNDAIAKRNLAIALSKNPAFMRVPSTGAIGLSEWYPGAKKKKEKQVVDPASDSEDTNVQMAEL